MTRKIEAAMNDAILGRKNWRSANTEVIYSPEREASYVHLHGNHIATIGENYVEVYSCGWRTATTKSRLNAILAEHALDGEYIYQENHNWYVRKYIGQLGTTPVYTVQEFEEGFIFS